MLLSNEQQKFLIDLGELHHKMCMDAGCKTNEECRYFLQDNIVSFINVKQSFQKFEHNNINEMCRLSKISDKHLKTLNKLKDDAERLDMMKFKFGGDVYYNLGFYKPTQEEHK